MSIAVSNMHFRNKTKLSYTFLRLLCKLSEFDRRTRKYGTDQPLYNAEIHTIKAIKETDGSNVTVLSDLLGVTKGDVSQIIKKLEKKGMVARNVDSDNMSRQILSLTSKGETAYNHHEEMHREFDDLFNDVLKNFSEENKMFLKKFLGELEERIDAFKYMK